MIARGAVLNDTYVIRERIGSGGGGVIYLAYHRRLQTDVVIKQIRDDIRSFVDVRAEVDLPRCMISWSMKTASIQSWSTSRGRIFLRR